MRRGIALLITAMFVIVISVAISYALRQINDATQHVKEENFLYQNTIFVQDVLEILKKSSDLHSLADDNSSEDLFNFLATNGFVTMQYEGVRLNITIKSARDRFNLQDATKENLQYMYEYFTRHNISVEYVDILKDATSGIKLDYLYKTRMFETEPLLFRDYLASFKQLQKINQFYKDEYGENSVDKIDMKQLFYFSNDKNVTAVDLNYATPEVMELVAGVSPQRAKELTVHDMIYTAYEDMGLSDTEINRIKTFKTSFFEPFLNIKIDIIKENLISHITFEYDIKNKRGYNFVYEI
jgi:hypothetical protein